MYLKTIQRSVYTVFLNIKYSNKKINKKLKMNLFDISGL